MKRLTILAIVAIVALSSSGCRRGARCFGLRGSSCGRPAMRAPWRKPQQQIIYQPVPVPVAAPAPVCPPPQASCDPCPPAMGCPAPGIPTVPGTTVQPYTQGYGTMEQVVPGGQIIDGGVISGGAAGGPFYGNVIGDRALQPSETTPGLQTVPIDQ